MRRPSFHLPSLTMLSFAALTVPVCFAAPVVSVTPACPVELSAEQGLAGSLAYAAHPNEAPPARGTVQQSIELSIKNSRLQRIVAADLEVHGTSPKGRLLHTGEVSLGAPAANAVRNVHLEGSVPADQQRTHALSVKDLTSVSWINVIELRYADGSVWHAGPGRVCRVEPNGLMRVGE